MGRGGGGTENNATLFRYIPGPTQILSFNYSFSWNNYLSNFIVQDIFYLSICVNLGTERERGETLLKENLSECINKESRIAFSFSVRSFPENQGQLA